jgi:hypothetical protein
MAESSSCSRSCEDALWGVYKALFVIWLFITPFILNHWNNLIWLMEGENARIAKEGGPTETWAIVTANPTTIKTWKDS